MSRFRFRRSTWLDPSHRPASTWMSILFLVPALVFVLLAGSRLADRMAGCYVDMAGPDAGTRDDAESHQEPEENTGTRVKILTP